MVLDMKKKKNRRETVYHKLFLLKIEKYIKQKWLIWHVFNSLRTKIIKFKVQEPKWDLSYNLGTNRIIYVEF